MENQDNANYVARHVTPLAESFVGVFVIAIDGKSGTGKSTLAEQLAEMLDAVVIKCDDFYTGGNSSRWKSLSIEEMNDTVINWRYIKDRILVPLKDSKTVSWTPFGSSETAIASPKHVIILEGAYSSREELSSLVNYRILTEMPEDLREKRIREREGDNYDEEWHGMWKPAMDYYFEVNQPRKTFDLIVTSN